MPVDRNAPLPKEVHETVTRWMDELTEELRTKFDPGFRPGVYVLYTTDGDELPDGLWIVFPPTMPAEMAYSFMEAGYNTMRTFIESGIIERLKILRKDRQNRAQTPDGNFPHHVRHSREKKSSAGKPRKAAAANRQSSGSISVLRTGNERRRR